MPGDAPVISLAEPCAVLEPNTVARWLMDTGRGSGLIGVHDAHACAGTTFGRGPPQSFNTANGTVKTRDTALTHIAELGQTAALCVLPSTPAVLSTGRRCVHEGYSFVWPAGELPYLVRPDGLLVSLQVDHDTPYLEPSTLLCRPAPPASHVTTPSPQLDAAPSVRTDGPAPTVRSGPRATAAAAPTPAVRTPPERAGPAPPPEPVPAVEVPGSAEDRVPALRRDASALEHMPTHRPKTLFARSALVHVLDKSTTGGARFDVNFTHGVTWSQPIISTATK